MKKNLNQIENVVVASDSLYRSVRKVIQEAQGVVSRVANWAMVVSNWRIGFLIVETSRKGNARRNMARLSSRTLPVA